MRPRPSMLSFCWSCCLLLVGGLGLACASTPEAPSRVADPTSARSLPAGPVIGYATGEGSHAWRGLPFAKPPVGELRWRAPEPLPAWQATRVALEQGSACVQYPMPIVNTGNLDQVIGDEDCLALNVFAPKWAPGAVPTGAERRPVMVWIHGGANLTGESATYDFSRFAAVHDVVVLAVNYRLGAFGWFRHPALTDGAGTSDDDFDRSGNFGTLDLIRALEWTRDNVAGFGGDPGNVTIFGESAGGNNVIALLLSPPARGLFHRAISQSGGTWSASVSEAENWVDDPEAGRLFSSREFIASLVQLDGIASSRTAAKQYVTRVEQENPEELGEYLRGKTAAQVMAVVADRKKVSMKTMPLTIRGGVVVAEGEMLDAFERGDYHKVPTILGTNRDESNLFMMFDPKYTWKLFGVLPRIRDPELYRRDGEYSGKVWKADGADQVAIAMREHQGPSVYAYRFDWDEQPSRFGTDFSLLIGAAHGIEIPFVIGGVDLGPLMQVLGGEKTLPQRQPLIDAMGSYWTEFAATGAPGRGSVKALGLPEWTPWDSSSETSPRFILFDSQNGGGIRMSADYVTADRIAEQVLADPRFASHDERCEALGRLVESFPRYTEQDRIAAGCGVTAPATTASSEAIGSAN